MSHRPTAILLVLLLAIGSVAPTGLLAADPSQDPPQGGSVVTAGGRVLPPLPDELNQPSIHAQMLAEHGIGSFQFAPGDTPVRGPIGQAPGDARDDAPGAAPAAQLPNGLRKHVFGFLPYWMLSDGELASMNYQLVSAIAYFSVGANRDGHLIKGTDANPSTGWAGWTSSNMTEVIDRAHANGVKVVLTVTMMAWDSGSAANQAALLRNPTARARLVDEIVDAVDSRSADGVNLDFEPLATALREEYVAFVRELNRGLTDAGVGHFLTVCVMASAATWATGYDVAGLTAPGAADKLFVMGYDFHWSGSSRAGGVAPIDSPYTIDVSTTMSDFLAETTGSKLIWGVPYYGRTWPTSSSQLNATTLGGGSAAYYYTGSLSQAQQFGRRWDDVGKVPWYRHWDAADGNWVQGYYDDVESLGAKYDLINARGLAGTGMWTLLMDQGRDELWRLLADRFVDDTAPPVGGISLLPRRVDAQAVKVAWRAIDHASGVHRYNVQVRPVGGPWSVWLVGTAATSAWYPGQAGTRYEFRVQAVDFKGNAQAWVSAPAWPAELTVGAFAQVLIANLNIRSGPGTGYGLVDTAVAGDLVHLLGGPTAAGGYDWYRVQYDFEEWPSADYARIGWVAAGASGGPYLGPAPAPTVTKLDPFVAINAVTRKFSPNGDGRQDTATVTFRLGGAAGGLRLDVVNTAGFKVRTLNLGTRGAGVSTATWNGRTGSGSWAAPGSYLLKVTATDAGGADHVGPTNSVNPAIFGRWGAVADLAGPTATGRPGRGAAMVPASAQLVIDFSEPAYGLSGPGIQLRRANGSLVPAAVWRRPDGRRALVTPDQPLPTGARLTLRFGAVRDAAGNAIATGGWQFTTAPGRVYQPERRMRIEVGSHVGYLVGARGTLRGPLPGAFSQPSGANVGQRATMPNLPGRWLHVENGMWAGRWMRESAGRWMRESAVAHLNGESERDAYPASSRIVLRAATHVGYRFAANGDITTTRSYQLGATSGANINARAIINGRPYLAVTNGVWAGYWMPESALAHVAGMIERLEMPSRPRIDIAAGTYTGFRYDDAGGVTGRVTATLPSGSGANVAAWAVINGRPHFRVANGIWAATWLPERAGISLDA